MPRPQQGTTSSGTWSDVDDLMAAPAYAEFCEGRLADPYPLLAWLRSNDPVHWSPTLSSWILATIALGRLLERFPDVRLLDPEPAWRENMTMRAHPRLSVDLAPA